MRIPTLALAAVLAAHAPATAHVNVDFEDLTLPPGQEYDNGAPADGGDNDDGFVSGDVAFSNDFTDFGFFTSWEGFSYSSVNDTTTPGFMNQYAAFTGTGFDAGDDTYGVSFLGSAVDSRGSAITLPVATSVRGVFVTNTTYAALSMLNGDSFAKQFGGDTGDDPDFFRLTIFGVDADGEDTGSVTVDLADYTFQDNSKDYVVDYWKYVDLNALGDEVKRLEFSLASSDTAGGFINTPAYFAMDNLVISEVPEPGTLSAFALAGAGLMMRRRRRA